MSVDSIRKIWCEVELIHDALDHEKRSREIADSTRRFIIGANTGAIAAVLAAAGKLMDVSPSISPRWALWPIVSFVVSFAMIFVSMTLAKRRELARRDAAADKPAEESRHLNEDIPLLFRSAFWDSIAAMILAAGILWALWSLNRILP